MKTLKEIISINDEIIYKISNKIERDHNKVKNKKPINIYNYKDKKLESHSSDKQDIFVIEKLNFKKNGYFIELGGDDGVRKSNTYFLERYFDWDGILIESKKAFSDCSKKIRKCHSVNATVDFKQHYIDFYYYHGSSGICDKDTDNDTRHNKLGFGSYVKLFTTTLDHILEEYKAPKNIDYLSLDIEGSEYRILKNFDFNKYNIKIISIERAFSIDKNNKSKEYINSKKLLQELLSNNNYKHIQSCGYDDMFIKE